MEEETLGSRYRSPDGKDYVNIVPLPGRTQVIIITFEDKDRLSEVRCPFYNLTKRTVVEREVNRHIAHTQTVKVR